MVLDNVALIPARGGSVGVARKNVKMLGDKPLIAWTIEAAQLAECVERVFVTTEDDEIADVSRQYGAEVLKRPSALATGDVQTDEVYLYTLRQLKADYDIHPRVLTLLQPTSPFRTSADIDRAHDLLPDDGSVLSVYQSDKFYWVMIDDEPTPVLHNPMYRVGRQWRDQSEKAFAENGAVYVVSADTLMHYRTYRVGPYAMHLMSEKNSLDIDSPEDFEACEKFLTEFLKNESS